MNWLLELSNPSVRFWALQDLEGKYEGDSAIVDLQDSIMQYLPIKKILEAQSPEGYWVNPTNMYLPKYTATTHSLLILAEMGAKRTPAIERGVENIFKFQRDSGHFLINLPKNKRGRSSKVKDGCCLDGNILYYLIYFGYFKDSRTQNLINFLIENHNTKNAGWLCRSYPIDRKKMFPLNCYMGAVKVLKSFAAIPAEQRTLEIKSIIEKEVENLLDNRIFRYLKTKDGKRKEKAGWKRFGFPLFYQTDILEVLDILTSLSIHDERMQDSINLIKSLKNADGRWILKNSFNGKMWWNIEEKGKPSKWITLRALRILKRYYNN
jgi:hypothetical protein